jgi:hypothetical protein
MRQGSKEHKKVIFILTLLMLMALSIGMHKYLTDPTYIFDDQREIIDHVKLYDSNSYDNFFYSSPLYFLFYLGLNRFLSNLLVMKLLFIIVIPILVIYAYNLGRIICEKMGWERLYFPALFPIVLSVFFLEDLMFGLQKAIAFSVFLGAIYYTVVGKKFPMLLCLTIVAFIYPPIFIVGIAFSGLYFLFQSLKSSENKTQKGIFNSFRRLNWKGILMLLVVLFLYLAYYLMVDMYYQRTSAKGTYAISATEKLGMDQEVKEQIENTSTRFVPSRSKYFGIIPKHYFNDIRMGLFGEIGGTVLWIILVVLTLTMWIINKNKFIVPDFAITLLLASSFLFLLSHIFYDKLYFPNRYTKFALPIVAVYLIGPNLPFSVKTIIQKIYLTNIKHRLVLSFISIAGAAVLLYISLFKKMIYLGTQFDRFEFTLFTMIIASLLIFTIILLLSQSVQAQRFTNFVIVYIVLLLVVLIYSINPITSPVKIYDRELFPVLNRFDRDVSLCGYPELMCTVHPFTDRPVKTNLGQGVEREDAFEFYHLLTAHYADRLDDVHEYMRINDYDFLIVQKEYFFSAFTEDNNLFSFYPVLRQYEKKLKKDNEKKFALLDPPRDIIEFESQKSTVISYQKLKHYLSVQ